MQIKLSKAKSLLEQYIHSEGRHWKSKVRELVDDAFLAYDGRLDYLKLTWDDYGLDTMAVLLQDKLDNQFGVDETRFSGCVAGLEKLSSFVHSTYSKYEEVPELVFDEIISDIKITPSANDGEDLGNTESEIISNKLLEYTRSIVIQYSYKPVLIKAICELSLKSSVIDLDEVLDYFDAFYRKMYLKYSVCEKANSIFSRLNHSKLLALDLLRNNPIQILEKAKIITISNDGKTITILSDIQKEIVKNRELIQKECDAVLDTYYEKLVSLSDTRYSVYEHTNPYGRKKRGITRSECKDRIGYKDSCVILATKLTFDEADKILDETELEIDLVDYYGDPLHVLSFDSNGKLINSYDSILEAACLLGIKPAYIKACCRGEVKDSRYEWKYGDKYISEFLGN